MSRYRFLGRPRFLLFTAVMAALVVAMVNLAFWQLRRLDERRHLNAEVVAREAEPTTSLRELLAPDATPAEARAAEWRSATATGTYDEAHQVLIRNRDLGGQSGYHVVTPLLLADGAAVLVNRGWIPLESDAASAPTVPIAPSGEVTVTGRVRPSQHKGRFFSPSDPPEGTLTQLYRVDVPRIAEQVPYELVPAYLELLTTDPAPAGRQPAPIPPPVLDEGPHLSYAIQWFFFSGCAVVGWVLAVRRSARKRERVVARATVAPASDVPAETRSS